MSQALLTVVVSDDNGNSFDVGITSRTVLKWERQFPGRSFAQLETKFSYVYEAVFVAAQAKLPEGLSFTAFTEGYDLNVVDEPVSVDPTQPAA